ncbi:MAG: ankyrin repeat domain-containing protein [Alphaproteobacteria bacterium]|nr:MAG: ankyrin repeat domain-containing protein [Alphaproteobacteria bacterium]
MPTKKFNLAAANDNGPNPDRELLRAAEGGDLEKVKFWLERGANIDARHTNNDTPLIIAAREGHEDVIRHLMTRRKKKADAAMQNNQDESALHAAVAAGNTEIAVLLVKLGAPAGLKDTGGATPAWHAAAKGNVELIDALAQGKADLNTADNAKTTPLMQAVKTGQLKAAGALLENRVALDAQDDKGMTALMYAVLQGANILPLAVISLGADIEIKNAAGQTALDLARTESQVTLIRCLEDRLAALHEERYGPFHNGTGRRIAPMKPLTLLPPGGKP